MTLLAAWLLGVGAVAAGATVLLHLLARNVPPEWRLPTARFVPAAAVSALTRSRTPRDLAVLFARLLALTAIALAAAGPLWQRGSQAVTRIFVADLTRTVASRSTVVDAIASRVTDADRIVALTDRATVVSLDSLRTLAAVRPPVSRGLLSSALLLAATVPARSPSAALVVVSPLARDIVDAAWPAASGTWRGAITTVRAGEIVRSDSAAFATVSGSLTDDDPLAASLAAGGIRTQARAPVLLQRTRAASRELEPTADNLVRVEWPRQDAPDARDTSGAFAGLALGDTVLVAPLYAVAVEPTDAAAADVDTLVRWLDGSAAATEVHTNGGCVRHVGIGVPANGDLVVRERWLALVRRLLGPCGGVRDTVVVADSVIARAATPTGSRQAALLPEGQAPDPWLVRALMLLAAAALATEWWLRRRGAAA